MTQATIVLANTSRTAYRAAHNAANLAMTTLQSGASEPSPFYAYMLWADTTTGLLKLRNAANSAWVSVGTMASANLGLVQQSFSSSLSIAASTADGADNLSVTITAGGGASGTRGAYVQLMGNENAQPGYALISSGTAAGAALQLSGPADGIVLTATYVQLSESSPVYINDAANANNTLGVTVNQGAADDEIISLKSSDIAHGITGVSETDTYGYLKKFVGSTGGLEIVGLRETGGALALNLIGISDGADTVAGTGAFAPVMVRGYRFVGTAVANATANQFIFGLLTQKGGADATVFLVDEDGDFFNDGASGTGTTFDAYNDVALLRAFDMVRAPASIIRSKWDEMVRYGQEDLERAGILTKPKTGRGMVNQSQLQRVLVGNAWQQHVAIQELKDEIARLKQPFWKRLFRR